MLGTIENAVGRKTYDLISDIHMVELEFIGYLEYCNTIIDMPFEFKRTDFEIFLEWYNCREYAKCVVPTERCQEILNLMFNLNINIY